MRKMLDGAAEFCLLSASSKLPFIMAGALEGGNSDSDHLPPWKYEHLTTFHPQSCG